MSSSDAGGLLVWQAGAWQRGSHLVDIFVSPLPRLPPQHLLTASRYSHPARLPWMPITSWVVLLWPRAQCVRTQTRLTPMDRRCGPALVPSRAAAMPPLPPAVGDAHHRAGLSDLHREYGRRRAGRGQSGDEWSDHRGCQLLWGVTRWWCALTPLRPWDLLRGGWVSGLLQGLTWRAGCPPGLHRPAQQASALGHRVLAMGWVFTRAGMAGADLRREGASGHTPALRRL